VKGEPKPYVAGHWRAEPKPLVDFSRPGSTPGSVDYGDERLPVHFWEKVYPEPNTGCWLWGAATTRGHAVFWLSHAARLEYAHRVIWTATVGAIDDEMEIDHLCRQRCCVLPAHLEPVTHQVNVARGHARYSYLQYRQDACVRGHLFTPENTIVPEGTDQRVCRACKRIRSGQTA
jgi:hypothetical protein